MEGEEVGEQTAQGCLTDLLAASEPSPNPELLGSPSAGPVTSSAAGDIWTHGPCLFSGLHQKLPPPPPRPVQLCCEASRNCLEDLSRPGELLDSEWHRDAMRKATRVLCCKVPVLTLSHLDPSPCREFRHFQILYRLPKLSKSFTCSLPQFPLL
jgi:hypothetical protein